MRSSNRRPTDTRQSGRIVQPASADGEIHVCPKRFQTGQAHVACMDSVARRFVTGHNRPIDQGFVNWIGAAQGQGALVNDTQSGSDCALDRAWHG